VGLGTEFLFMLMLGLLILGPKQLHTLLGLVGRAKAEFGEASRTFKSQLAAELDATHRAGETPGSHECQDDAVRSDARSRKPGRQHCEPHAG
jgi:Sec-independent protein translocase protein TatA